MSTVPERVPGGAAAGRCVVISQPMYFPWVGMLEQIRLADAFVFYDDVQFSRGSFTNRVQLKDPQGVRWMTVPLRGLRLGQRIDEVEVDDRTGWRDRHRELLRQACTGAPYLDDALDLLDGVLNLRTSSLCELARGSMLASAEYFGLVRERTFLDASRLGLDGIKSARVLDICARLGAARYVTGHGASRYLDHALFDREGIAVDYMDYRLLPYPQRHGTFTPYVSALDLVANCGREGVRQICSGTVGWRDMLARRQEHAAAADREEART